MNKKCFLLSFIVLGCLASQGYANTNTLEKIKSDCAKSEKDCIISVGVRDSSIPFSYKLNEDQYVGYSYDIAQYIVNAVKSKLALPALKIKNIPITSQNRIPLLQNGTIDIECGSTTNNVERQKQVAFTNSIFIIGTQLLTHKDSKIKDFEDLKDKTVVTTAGTTSERLLKKMNVEKSMGMNIISAKDHGQADLILQMHRAVAFMMDDALLYGERAKAKNPADWIVVGTPQSYEAYGCMIRQNDPEFKKLTDHSIAEMMESGKTLKLYEKWFMNKIPPHNIVLHFPLSQQMKELFQHPNDKAFE